MPGDEGQLGAFVDLLTERLKDWVTGRRLLVERPAPAGLVFARAADGLLGLVLVGRPQQHAPGDPGRQPAVDRARRRAVVGSGAATGRAAGRGRRRGGGGSRRRWPGRSRGWAAGPARAGRRPPRGSRSGPAGPRRRSGGWGPGSPGPAAPGAPG